MVRHENSLLLIAPSCRVFLDTDQMGLLGLESERALLCMVLPIHSSNCGSPNNRADKSS